MSNLEINKTYLKNLSKSLGVSLTNKDIVQEALTHRSYRSEHKDAKFNERLEFIGDAVLELVVTEFLFNKYAKEAEGQLTSYRAALVRTESLAFEASRINLGKYIQMSTGEEQTGGREREYILANTVEAVIGAIYICNGYLDAKKFIEKNICYKIDTIVSERLDVDSKSKLQELSQEDLKITPVYSHISSTGPDHNKVFEMALMIGEHEFSRGKGKSKQEAEQNAAQNALDNWEKLIKKYYK